MNTPQQQRETVTVQPQPNAFAVRTMASDRTQAARMPQEASTTVSKPQQPESASVATAPSQNPGPFLAQNQRVTSAMQQGAQTAPSYAAYNVKGEPIAVQNTGETVQRRVQMGRIIMVAAVLLIAGALVLAVMLTDSGTTLRSWIGMTGSSREVTENEEDVTNDAEAVQAVAQEEESTEPAHVDVPQEKPSTQNTSATEMLSIGGQMTSADLTRAMQDIIKKHETDAPRKIIMLSVVDEQKKAMPVSLFATRFLPQLPKDVAQSIDGSMEILLVPDNTAYRTVIYGTTESPDRVRTALRAAESQLPQALLPIFLATAQPQKNVVFKDSVYKNIPVRYMNLAESQGQSIDYSTHYEHVFIATSSASLRSAMDEILQLSVMRAAEPVLQAVSTNSASVAMPEPAVTPPTQPSGNLRPGI